MTKTPVSQSFDISLFYPKTAHKRVNCSEDSIIKSDTNPETNTNPSEKGTIWINYQTNELFICTDNTTDSNIWIGNKKTIISTKKIYTYDIFNDLTSIAFFQLDDDIIDMGGKFDISIYNTEFEIGKIEKCLKLNSTNSKIELFKKS